MIKIWNWIKANLASVIGISQAAIKALKELLTAVVNLISVFIPASTAQDIVYKIRDFLNLIDGWIEKAKPYLIPEE